MKYRRKRASPALVGARQEIILSGISMDVFRYWRNRNAGHSTLFLYLCAARNDPFAKRIWAKTMAEYLKRCATDE